ncbi:hypothetical protein V6N11_018329 [Hibiscus sabdariffa]|uniref:Uncharacterized protein n=1 Tax=Hibiscus sabdariffa TaxID=183260 RepID=A0ABR2T718_9ROSI
MLQIPQQPEGFPAWTQAKAETQEPKITLRRFSLRTDNLCSDFNGKSSPPDQGIKKQINNLTLPLLQLSSSFSGPKPPPGSSGIPNPPEIVPSPPSIFPSPPQAIPSPTIYVPSPPVFLPLLVYPPQKGPSTTLWCVAKPSVPGPIMQEAMNYGCASGGRLCFNSA